MTLVPEHLREVPYAGALFIALSAAALATAILLSATDSQAIWRAAGAVSLGALVAYVLSRSVGLPSMADDIGDWANALGLAAVGCETLTLICWAARWAGAAPTPGSTGLGPGEPPTGHRRRRLVEPS